MKLGIKFFGFSAAVLALQLTAHADAPAAAKSVKDADVSVAVIDSPVVAPAPQALLDAFYDPNVKDADFLSQAQVTSVEQLKALLPSLYSTQPSKLFADIGKISSFELTPAEYGVAHAINYYIPKSYRADGKTAVLVILHGGGESTNTHDSAKYMSQFYMQDFLDYAEKNGVVLIGPSSSLGWSYITRILVSQTIALARKELAVDPDRIYVWGHSMGAMGLTRETHWLISQGAAFMPNAGGMQDDYRVAPIIKTYFDTRFIHDNGLHDGFTDFLIRLKDVEAKMGALERSAKQKSGFRAIYEDRDHNMDMATVVDLLESDVMKRARNNYQKDLNPILVRLDAKGNRLGPDVASYAVNKYFWIEAPKLATDLPRKEYAEGKNENLVSFSASVKSNVYTIKGVDPRISKLRVLISSKMVNMDLPIVIRVNGSIKHVNWVRPNLEKMTETLRSRKDRSMVFESYVDVNLK